MRRLAGGIRSAPTPPRRPGPCTEGHAQLRRALGATAGRRRRLCGDRRDGCRHTRRAPRPRGARMLSRPDTFARLHRIVCPTLLLAGEADTATPLVAMQKMAREMPSAKLRSLRGGGHFRPLERAEAVAELIGVWLETLDAPHTLTD
ncbi:alpha/beta fold hydrolase [Salipiger sp. HF18]|uniref:alpha/beta fold hydrolase n=1 Tax=Salipiger sp. HF18 TaxID=2721557 RepID=UPI0020CB12FD|nr:alpha/beta fold hydrolase [Salipiger sp. HF18]